MDYSSVSFALSLLAVVIAISALLQATKKQDLSKTPVHLLPLQLQAYERLVLLCERIALPNLISRTASTDLSAKEMQFVLLENIKQEYEYNASQQIYVSPGAWDAVRNLKDQSMLEINQIANALPPEARASDLNKHLLQVIIGQQEKPLHTVVLNILNAEAKKLLK